MAGRTRIHGIPELLRILVAMRFFATGLCYKKNVNKIFIILILGSYQRIVGDGFLLSVSQTTVSRCITEVSKAICDNLMDKYIKFPQTAQEMAE